MFSSEHASQLPNAASKVQWPLHFAFSYVQLITQRYKKEQCYRTAPVINPVSTEIRMIPNIL